jgi:hypothetical protein
MKLPWMCRNLKEVVAVTADYTRKTIVTTLWIFSLALVISSV